MVANTETPTVTPTEVLDRLLAQLVLDAFQTIIAQAGNCKAFACSQCGLEMMSTGDPPDLAIVPGHTCTFKAIGENDHDHN